MTAAEKKAFITRMNIANAYSHGLLTDHDMSIIKKYSGRLIRSFGDDNGEAFVEWGSNGPLYDANDLCVIGHAIAKIMAIEKRNRSSYRRYLSTMLISIIKDEYSFDDEDWVVIDSERDVVFTYPTK